MEANNESVVIERNLNAPANKVWKALTNRDQMKQWYFDLKEFKQEVGFEFQFEATKDDITYIHLCKITEVVFCKKLTYSWRYHGFEGISYVTFELFPGGDNQTRLKLTHTGLETFPRNNPDFDKHNFVTGWTDIIGRSLKEFLETKTTV